MHAPVGDGHALYARYTFSYRSTLPENGARVMLEGVAIMTLRDGKIAVPRVATPRRPVDRQLRAGTDRQDIRQAGRGAESAAGDGAASGGVGLSFRGARSANPESRSRGARFRVRCCASPRNDDVSDYGGGCFAIGFFCANAATVEVPIRPCSS
jgi:hypothetical protein